MKTGLAAWHYQHRDIVENTKFFLGNGFDYVSHLGDRFYEALSDENTSRALAEALGNTKCTVHFSMPRNHGEEQVAHYKSAILKFAAWQEKYGLIDVLSFDVHEAIRDNITPYLDFLLENMKNTKLALEDYGLNERELASISHLRGNENFGYLLDIGHMYIRFSGKNTSGETLHTKSVFEANEATAEGFYKTFAAKTFPIFEIHLHNNDGVNDQHRFLADGTLDIENVAAALKKFGYEGKVTLESAPGYKFECLSADADNGIMKSRDFFLQMLDKH